MMMSVPEAVREDNGGKLPMSCDVASGNDDDGDSSGSSSNVW